MLAVHFVLSVYPVFTYTPKMIFVLGFHLFPPIPYNFNMWQAFCLKLQNHNPFCEVRALSERWMRKLNYSRRIL